jgi:hypothetical protein
MATVKKGLVVGSGRADRGLEACLVFIRGGVGTPHGRLGYRGHEDMGTWDRWREDAAWKASQFSHSLISYRSGSAAVLVADACVLLDIARV